MRPTFLLLVFSVVPLPGCCSLARFFCGPDKSEWVSERYDTPRQTVQTLFEAIRRDDAQVVYLCLSKGYRRRLGLDGLTAQVAWKRLTEQIPGLHVAGYAAIPEPTRTGDDKAHVRVEAEGRMLDVQLERQAYQEIRYRRADGSLSEQGEIVPSLARRARVEAEPTGPADDEARSALLVAAFRFVHPIGTTIPLEAIEYAALVHRWKVADVQVHE